jgi:5'-3' exonuclease
VHLHLLDGTYELFRNYYGAPKRVTAEGVEVGAVQGLVAGTLRLVQDGGVTHLGAAFDTVIRSFRNDLFPGYKTEAGVPADLLAQFPIAEEGVEALGVVAWRMTTYEADDALATAAARFAPQVEQVVLMSPDKDLAQCVQGQRVARNR